jgi:class 3 adenylate cyclase
VLFADVKGSMELAQQTGPEVWHQILGRFLAILTEGVHRFERHGQPVHARRHPLQAERLKHQAAARIDRPRSD